MRHAILGAGGVGLLVGGGLAQAGQPVLLILRPETLERYPGGIRVESVVLGEFDVDVAAAPRLDRPVDVLWVTVKANDLESALALAAPAVAPEAVVGPLLNGVEHVAPLREGFGDQVRPGSIPRSWSRRWTGYRPRCAARCRRTSRRVGLRKSTRSPGRCCAGAGSTACRRRRWPSWYGELAPRRRFSGPADPRIARALCI